jgi:hypothetical protein
MIIKKKLIIEFIIIFCLVCKYINNLWNEIIIFRTNKIKIKIAIFSYSVKNGGVERQTSLMLHYFNKVKIFDLFLFTLKHKEENEYKVDENIKRIVIKRNLFQILIENNIDILIYQFYKVSEIKKLNNLKKTKTIFINHSCFLHWIYYNKLFFFKTVYKTYRQCKYLISLVPFENNYLFKKWGINSILMNNFIGYKYNSIKPSDLSSKTILMIGRGNDRIKRFEIGIKAMKYIANEIPECEMKIISKTDNLKRLKYLVTKMNLNKNIEFVGYISNPSMFYTNASLHLFPTLAEAFPNILSETLVYGIPNILAGLDYVSTAKGGTVIIYDDSPISIAKIAIKILKNKRYRIKLGKGARNNMKKFRNDLLLRKWIKLLLSIYKGENYYKFLRQKKRKSSEVEYINIINNQLKLLKLRNKQYLNISINNIENFTFMENIEKYLLNHS